MPISQAAQSFIMQVSEKLGSKFAWQLHTAINSGRTDPKTRAALRKALRAVSASR